MILLIENIGRDEEWTKVLLSRNRITNEVCAARDGESALKLLLGASEKGPGTLSNLPVFILLSSSVGKVGAVEIIRRLRENPGTRKIPILALCSSAEEMEVFGRMSGEKVFPIHKPLGFYKLVEALNKLGLSWTVSAGS